MSVFLDPKKFGDGPIAAFGSYKPWYWHKLEGGDASNYPEYSGRLLDLKEGKPHAVKYFYERIAPDILPGTLVAIVPSHDPAKLGHGLIALAQELERSSGCVDGSSCLIRHTKINKLAHGGDRSLDVHLNSIKVATPKLVAGQSVLLLDDVFKTGNSLIACRKLLVDAGAKYVQCAGIGRAN